MPYPPLQVMRRAFASRQRIQLQARELFRASARWTFSEVRPTLVSGQAALTVAAASAHWGTSSEHLHRLEVIVAADDGFVDIVLIVVVTGVRRVHPTTGVAYRTAELGGEIRGAR